MEEASETCRTQLKALTDMTTQLHLGIHETRSFRTFPLTILAWLETTALRMELAPFVRRSRECNRWFLCCGEETFGPVPFGKIMALLLSGQGPLSVLHESDAALDPAPWQAINYRAWPMNTAGAIAWIAGCWLLAVGLGFVVVTLACPVPARPIVGTAYLVAIVAGGVWQGLRVPCAPVSPQTDPETPADAEFPSATGPE